MNSPVVGSCGGNASSSPSYTVVAALNRGVESEGAGAIQSKPEPDFFLLP